MTPQISLAPIGWVLWTSACFVLLHTTLTPWASACVVAAVLVGWWTSQGSLPARGRAGLGAPLATLAAVLVLAWVLVTFAVGMGDGDVVWVLPEWADPSGVPIGGPVTTGALLGGAEQAMRALAHVALLACLLRCLDGTSAARLVDASFGRAAAPLHPLCFVGDVLVEDERARKSELAYGLTPLGWRQRGTLRRAAERAMAWRALTAQEESPLLVRWRLLSAVVLVLTALLLATSRHVRGTDAAVAALLLVAAVGLTTSLLSGRARLRRPDVVDLAPWVGALAVLVAVIGARAGGLDPTLAALSVLALPVLLMAREVVGR